MRYRDRAGQILTEAEAALRSLVRQAAAAGDYDAIVEIAKIARDVESVHHAGMVDTIPSIKFSEQREVPLKRRSLPDVAVSTSRKKYPAFFRSNDLLVKVGWSKKHRAEYEHRAPRLVLDAWIETLGHRARHNGRFSTGQLL